MVPFSTVQFSVPTLTHPVRSLPLNSDTHCSLGSRLALFLGVCARKITGSASITISLRITTGSIIKSDAKSSGGPSLFSPGPGRAAISARMPAHNRRFASVDFHPVRGGPAVGRHQRAGPVQKGKRTPVSYTHL